MSFNENKRNEIKHYIFEKIRDDDEYIVSKVADSFGISLTSVKRYLDSEIKDKNITLDSNRKSKYALIQNDFCFERDIKVLTEREDDLIFDDIFPLLNVNENSKKIWSYVLPEIFNNVIEHSNGSIVKYSIKRNCLYSEITVSDDGVGVFKNIMNYMKQSGNQGFCIQDAVGELYKGKFTSCPERHSGEGIYFSMKLLDSISIISDGIVLKQGYKGDSVTINSHLLAYAMKFEKKGTVVIMRLDNNSNRNAIDVFNTFSEVDEGFVKTCIPVFEACSDRNPISRSQARRLCNRLNQFKEVVLDFEKVDMMAQGFADELFRVFHNENPDVILTPINMNEETKKMYLYTIHNKVNVI